MMPLLFLPALLIGFAPSASEAITCTGAVTNPPGGTVNSSTLCGAGTGNNDTGNGNPGAVQLNSLASFCRETRKNLTGATWAQVFL